MKEYAGQPIADVTNSKDYVLIQFHATWCNPCKMLSPVIEAVSKKVTDVDFYKVDIDQYRNVAVDHGIKGVPTLVMFQNGKEIARQSGYQPQPQLEAWIEKSKNA